MEYTSYIVDELGCIVYRCSDLNDKEVEEILSNHEEWTIRCISEGGY